MNIAVKGLHIEENEHTQNHMFVLSVFNDLYVRHRFSNRF